MVSIAVAGNDVGNKCWKNGTEINIPDCYTIRSMSVVDNNVYVAGNDKNVNEGQGSACYWINGTAKEYVSMSMAYGIQVVRK